MIFLYFNFHDATPSRASSSLYHHLCSGPHGLHLFVQTRAIRTWKICMVLSGGMGHYTDYYLPHCGKQLQCAEKLLRVPFFYPPHKDKH